MINNSTKHILPNGMEITIRLEEKKDYYEVENLTRRAFWKKEHFERLGGIGCDEHYLCSILRPAPEYISALGFVAEHSYKGKSKIIANIMYTMSYIQKPDGSRIVVITFGPLSVLPEYQKIGVGSEIMLFSINAAKSLGYGAILIFGHPEYYPRFGFVEAKEFNITTSEGNNFPAFMGMELIPGYLGKDGGSFHEASLFNSIDNKKAQEYDKLFPSITPDPQITAMTEEHLPFLNRILNTPSVINALHSVPTVLKDWENAYIKWLSDTDEANFIIYSCERPFGWLKINGLENSDISWISMLVIDYENRRKGFGSFAINFAIEYLRKLGKKRIGIHTNEDNSAAQSCYEKNGFIITEKGDCTNGDGMHRTGFTYEKKLEGEYNAYNKQ